MTDDELNAALSVQARDSVEAKNGTAVMQINNTCPPGWGVIILNCGVNFYYDDGKSETDGPRDINLSGPSGSALFNSKSPKGCVQRMYVGLNVYVPNEGTKLFTENFTDCPPNQCMSSRALGIGPAANVSVDQSNSSILDRLKIFQA